MTRVSQPSDGSAISGITIGKVRFSPSLGSVRIGDCAIMWILECGFQKPRRISGFLRT
jgi:hypothetical protein